MPFGMRCVVAPYLLFHVRRVLNGGVFFGIEVFIHLYVESIIELYLQVRLYIESLKELHL